MEAVVMHAGSKLLEAGFAAPDQDLHPDGIKDTFKDGTKEKEVIADRIARGFVKDWDAMEGLLHHVLYTSLGWEIRDEGNVLFADLLSTIF